MGRTVAIFDVDGTLVPRPGTEVRMARFLARRGVLGLRGAIDYLAALPRGLRRRGRLCFKTNKAYLSGLETDRLARLADAFLDEAGERLWVPAVRARLDAHRQAGHGVGLLTGTPDFLAAAIARRLGAEAWEATVLDVCEGRVTGRDVLQHPYGPDKVAIARRMAGALGGELAEAWAYGDAWADRHLLAAVAHPVVVGPGRRINRLARERAWESVADVGT